MTRHAEHVGPYQLLHPLGVGGMAETFLAVRRGPQGFEKRVCLKRILTERGADPTFVELFLDEARLLARLSCRNITQVHEFGEVDGRYYMALELVDGVDLDKLLKALAERGERMPLEVALYVTGELLSALSYAHELTIDGVPQQIVHRDISPSNILLSKQGEVKLTDFGIAKARGRMHRTETGHTKGKVAYMSPEQVRAEDVDARSDLFAIGVVLFEMLTGAHPFEGNTDFAVQVNIVAGRRRSLTELLPDAPPSVRYLVDVLLAQDRSARPASANDALSLLPAVTSTFSVARMLAQLVAGERLDQRRSPLFPAPGTPASYVIPPERGDAEPPRGNPGSSSGRALRIAIPLLLILLAGGGYALARTIRPAAATHTTLTPEPASPPAARAATAADLPTGVGEPQPLEKEHPPKEANPPKELHEEEKPPTRRERRPRQGATQAGNAGASSVPSASQPVVEHRGRVVTPAPAPGAASAPPPNGSYVTPDGRVIIRAPAP